MNLLHMKYAVEIAKTSSLNKAAETLFVGQSALSRAIKELESSLGVPLFDRSSKGMTLTADGELFIHYAKSVLKQVENIENMFSQGKTDKQRFSISVAGADYIAEAFARFSLLLEKDVDSEIYFTETNSITTVKNVLSDSSKLGIIRYAQSLDGYYKDLMEEKGLTYELVCEFAFKILVSKSSPIAGFREISSDFLRRFTELSRNDLYNSSLSLAEGKKEELPGVLGKRIFLCERATELRLLGKNPDAFMWTPPLPAETLEKYGLVTVDCADSRRIYKDLLIRRENYKLTRLDEMFIEQLIKCKREIF